MTAGVNHAPVEKTKEAYTAKIVYQDADAKSRRHLSHKFNTIAGFNAGVTALLAAAAVTTAHGGTAVHDTETGDVHAQPSSATIRTANCTW